MEFILEVMCLLRENRSLKGLIIFLFTALQEDGSKAAFSAESCPRTPLFAAYRAERFDEKRMFYLI